MIRRWSYLNSRVLLNKFCINHVSHILIKSTLSLAIFKKKHLTNYFLLTFYNKYFTAFLGTKSFILSLFFNINCLRGAIRSYFKKNSFFVQTLVQNNANVFINVSSLQQALFYLYSDVLLKKFYYTYVINPYDSVSFFYNKAIIFYGVTYYNIIKKKRLILMFNNFFLKYILSMNLCMRKIHSNILLSLIYSVF